MLIKISIVVLAFYFIYIKLTTNSDLEFSNFTEFLSKNNLISLKNIIVLLLLSSCNWLFEILKWQKLVSSIKVISFKNALEQTLGSLTASLFTPNRIGEYGVKAMYYTKDLRKRIMLINLISNLQQMSITSVIGSIGCYLFITKYQITINYFNLLNTAILSLMIVGVLVFLIRKTKVTKGIFASKIQRFITEFPKNIMVFGILLSFLRYLVFSFQFYYLLNLFGIEIAYFHAMTLITTMYLLASIIPSIFIFDVVIKGGLAVYLFSFIGMNTITILSIVSIMWLFNFVVPSIFGSYFVLKFNLPEVSA
ncbi:lysylphosphatidylglycerol synthase domain-containing protein [Mariniflexile sp.]|uniref:lysylphosphatidylglycerol synthase domain-containing protein n=1 Tax=Mariniflexile sp. TaxID=1979402 RepID=UPI00356225C1